jgi:hypothetical protein
MQRYNNLFNAASLFLIFFEKIILKMFIPLIYKLIYFSYLCRQIKKCRYDNIQKEKKTRR